MSSKNDYNFNVRLNLPIFDQRPGIIGGILLTLYLCGSVLAWIYLLSLDTDSGSKILTMEIVVLVLLFAINLFGILKIGYDGYGRNFLASWILGIVLSVVGFYIIEVNLLLSPGREGVLYDFLQLVIYILFSSLICVVPTLLICAIIWVIEMIFGN